MRSLVLLCLSLTHVPAVAAPSHAQCAKTTFDTALARHGQQATDLPHLQRRLDNMSKTLEKCTDVPEVPTACVTAEDVTSVRAWSRAIHQVYAASAEVQEHPSLPANAMEQIVWRSTLDALTVERRASVIAERANEPLNNRPLIDIDTDIAHAQATIDALQISRHFRVQAENSLLDLRTSRADVSAAWNRSRCRVVQCTAQSSDVTPQQLDPACPGFGHARSATLIAELRLAATEIDQSITANTERHHINAIIDRLRPSFEPSDLSPSGSAARVLAQAMQGPVRPMSSVQALWNFVNTTDGLQRLTTEQRRYVAYAKPWVARWRRAAKRQRDLLDVYEAGWHVVGVQMKGSINDEEWDKKKLESRRDTLVDQRQLEQELQNLKLEPLATYQEFL